MFYVLQNESVAARKRCPILLTDSATGTTGQSGLAISNIYAYVSINGGAFAGAAGTVRAVNFGQYYYEFDASEINTLGLAGIHITAPGCRDYDAIVQVAAFNMYSVAGAGLTAGDVWSYGGGRSITGGIADTVTTVTSVTNPVSVSTASMTGIANTTWSTDVSAYTSPSAGYDVHNGAAGAGISAYDVWNFVLSDSSTAEQDLTGIYSLSIQIDNKTSDIDAHTQASYIANSVWSDDIGTGANTPYGAGTAGTILYDLSLGGGSGISAYDVWDFNITGFGGTNSAAVYVTDTNFTVGNIESYVQNQTPQDVWTYAGIEGRTITGGIADTVTSVINPVLVDPISMTGIAGTVWSTDISGYVSLSAGFDLTEIASVAGFIDSSISGVPQGVWEYDISAITTAGTAGSQLNLAASPSGAGLTAGDVWSYGGGRSITGGIADTVTTVSGNVLGSVNSVVSNVNVSTASMTGIAGTVWSVASRTITGGIADTVTTVTNRAGFAITGGTITTVSDKTGYSLSASQTFNVTGNITGNVSGSVGSVAGNVSGSVASVVGNVGGNVAGSVASVSGNVGGNVVGSVASVTNPVTVATASMTGIAGTVWSVATRTITGGTITTVSDKTGYSLSGTQAFNLTGNITGNLSGSVGSVTGNVGGNVTGSVASVTNPVTFNSGQYAAIASSVWNAGTRTLTSGGGGAGISAYDVWNFVLSDSNTAEVDLVQAASGAGITAGDVWTYATRTITGGIANTVTSVTNGVTVTTNNDKTGYALSGAGVSAVQSGLSTLTAAQVGTEVDSSLSDVGLTSTVTGRIDVAVSSRLASSSYVVPPTEAAIAGTVWSYSPRTLTSGAGATAGDVWTYPTRSLTSGAGITVNAATNIINGPYFVKSNVDGQDGTLDVIRGMVQNIQLTVTDAFQNPFDVTALGLAVNFYDQAGTLTTSYATTELYGPAGLVQFTLDTAVTANEGRYNLILSAAGAGNTIKFGPLQTLVRPF